MPSVGTDIRKALFNNGPMTNENPIRMDNGETN